MSFSQAGEDAAGTAGGRGGFMSLSSRGRNVVSWSCGEDIVCGARSHSVECIALISSTGPR